MSSEITNLRDRLLAPGLRITEDRALATELQTRLSVGAIKKALDEGSSSDGEWVSNGWSMMLKAVIVKLEDQSRSSHSDFVIALSMLVEEADKAGALFEGTIADSVVGHILDNLFDESSAQSAQRWFSILAKLASKAEYFRAVGREAAQARCKQLCDFSWETLLRPRRPTAGAAIMGRVEALNEPPPPLSILATAGQP